MPNSSQWAAGDREKCSRKREKRKNGDNVGERGKRAKIGKPLALHSFWQRLLAMPQPYRCLCCEIGHGTHLRHRTRSNKANKVKACCFML